MQDEPSGLTDAEMEEWISILVKGNREREERGRRGRKRRRVLVILCGIAIFVVGLSLTFSLEGGYLSVYELLLAGAMGGCAARMCKGEYSRTRGILDAVWMVFLFCCAMIHLARSTP